MERLDPLQLASVLATTSISNIAGLLAADPTWKARAADCLAHDIAARLSAPAEPDRDQLALPL